MQHRAITIIGGGPIGLTMALLLAQSGQSSTLFDIGNNAKASDGRVLALSYASVQLLREYGAWPENLATAINQVHISHSGLGVSNIFAADVALENLGYTIKYADICATLKDAVKKYDLCEFIATTVNEITPGTNFATITHLANGNSESVTADLVILAEGGRIKLVGTEYEDYDYGQTAIIAKLTTQKKPAGIAYERFENSGSLVLLPHGKDYVLVWSLANAMAEEYGMFCCASNDRLESYNHEQRNVNADILLNRLSAMPFMHRFGKLSIDNTIHFFPLKLQFAKKRVATNVVLIGNSAQTVHPVSAQGMNLGLRDALTLSELLLKHTGLDELQRYDALRQKDAKRVIDFTHGLAKFLEVEIPLIKHVRGAGIIALSNCKLLQNKIAKGLIFGA